MPINGIRKATWAAFLCLLFLAAGAAEPLRAAETPVAPEDTKAVVIIVNAASADSEAVGAYYAKRRGVPDSNICRVRCTTSEVMSRREFDAEIRGPLRAFLVERRLAALAPSGGLADLKVKYLVPTYGVPVKIRDDYGDAKLEDLPRKPTGRTAAAVDSELCLLARPSYLLQGWIANPAYRQPAPAEPVIFCARLDGPTPEIARGLVDAALDAERDGLFGIAYIDARGIENGPYKVGDDWLLGATAALEVAGFFTRLDREPATFHPDMPMPDAAFYFGWYAPDLCGPMAAAAFRFRRGTVAYHLHSASAARLRTDRSGWAGPLLTKGAAATMGAVFEPYLPGTIDIAEFTRLFLSGRTFAESACRATPMLSWMMAFVGDPLYAPFRKDKAADLPPFWRDVRDAVRTAAQGDAAAALGVCSKHDTEPLFVEIAAAVCLKAGRDADAIDRYRQLARVAKDPYSSVQAHLRIAGRLAASRQPDAVATALDAYIDCIRAHPGSPHAVPAYKAALALARSLGRKDAEAGLWARLAADFPGRALGRFAAAELWARGLRKDCPVPWVAVRQAAGNIAIDGRTDDPAWGRAAAIDALAFRSGGGAAALPARIRLAYDDSALQVLAEFPRDPAAGAAARPAPAEDTLEITLSPARDARHAVGITVQRNGAPAGSSRGIEWRFAPLAAPQHGPDADGGWCVEVRIPFAALGQKPPTPDSAWAVNFVYRFTTTRFPFRTTPVFQSWARPDADPLAPECAGLLIFR